MLADVIHARAAYHSLDREHKAPTASLEALADYVESHAPGTSRETMTTLETHGSSAPALPAPEQPDDDGLAERLLLLGLTAPTPSDTQSGVLQRLRGICPPRALSWNDAEQPGGPSTWAYPTFVVTPDKRCRWRLCRSVGTRRCPRSA